MLIILLFLIILFKIDELSSINALPENDYNSFDRYETLEEEEKADYQMLMNYERQKSKLQTISNSRAVFSDLFVIETNDTQGLKDIFEKNEFVFLRKVFEDENFYLFRKPKCRRRCKRRAEEFFRNIEQHPQVRWTARQSLQDRYRRIPPESWLQEDGDNDRQKLLSEVREMMMRETHNKLLNGSLKFNDPLFREQWYLNNWGQTGSSPENDINVYPVWESGITGKGVVISVLDDGVHGQSEEVAENFARLQLPDTDNPSANTYFRISDTGVESSPGGICYCFMGSGTHPDSFCKSFRNHQTTRDKDSKSSEAHLFRTSFHPIPENSHGTRCAAIAAGVANNGVCGVGVAYGAKVGGIRLLDGSLTDVQEALALVHASNHIDIYTASWGPNDKGTEVDGPKILTRMALIKGVTMGRQGKGSIYVWAAGNGGGYYDNCSLDGYASSPFTLTIGALTEDGFSTFYSEPCPAVIVSTYVGGSSHKVPTLESWKKDKKKIKVVVPEGRGKCKETFQGTSAAAPMAAGVLALMLQANPNLTWRDVQHLIIRTSRIPTMEEDGWITNGAGFHFHPKIGSGVLNAHALVTLAKKWTPVPNLRIWTTPANRRKWLLPPRKTVCLSLQILESSMPSQSRISEVETVIITINLRHPRRGDLQMILQSPSGTPSPILTRRHHDNRTTGFDHWDFVSLHFWGEQPEGVWELKVLNHNERLSGFIDYISITLFGTE